MTEASTIDLKDHELEQLLALRRPPSHPGALVADELEELGMTVTAAARHLHISRGHLHRILAGTSPVSGEVAVRLGRMFGNGPGLWARMQLAYDLWHAERAVPAGEVRPIEPVGSGTATERE
jgi:addiction module HigA family antidote